MSYRITTRRPGRRIHETKVNIQRRSHARTYVARAIDQGALAISVNGPDGIVSWCKAKGWRA